MTLSSLQQKLIFVWFRRIDRPHTCRPATERCFPGDERKQTKAILGHASLWGPKCSCSCYCYCSCSCEKLKVHREFLLFPGHSHGHLAFGWICGLYFPTPVMREGRFSCRIDKYDKQRARDSKNEFNTINPSGNLECKRQPSGALA